MSLPGNERTLKKSQRWSATPGARSATCPAGSLIFPKRGGAIGTNKKRIVERPCILDPNLMAVEPTPGQLDGDYLYHWFQSFDLSQIANGSSIPQLNKKDLTPLRLPLPPISMQRKIAEILNHLDTLRAKRREAISLLEDLSQSIFRDMFGDVVKNDRGWDEHRTLGDAAFIVSGITKGRRAPNGPLRSVPYMAVANVQERRLDLSAVKEIEATADEIDRYRLLEDDLLLTEGGDPDKLGRGTLWRNELPECIHQNHIFRVRLREGSGIDPIFLNWLVASNRGRSYFLRSAKQTTGIASINATQLKNFPLLIPPIKLQQDFGARIRHLEQCKSSHGEHLSQLDALFASIRHRAFRGELWSIQAASAT
ncbi:restriction endonuclease subunit S [Streptomyces sp. NPDC026666]